MRNPGTQTWLTTCAVLLAMTAGCASAPRATEGATAATAPTQSARKPASDLPRQLVGSYMETARLLSSLSSTDQICETGAFPGEVLSNLMSAFSVAESIGAPKPAVPAVVAQHVGNTLTYKLITGELDFANEDVAAVAKAIEGVTFYARNGGAYGPNEMITFLPGGKVKVLIPDIDSEGELKHTERTGTWVLKEKKKGWDTFWRVAVVVNLPGGKTKTRAWRLAFTHFWGEPAWVLKTSRKNAPEDDTVKFVDYDLSACDA
jgi:hypothetical protein